MDEDSTILKEEIRKSEDDVMKNKNRSPPARKEVNEYIPQINISNSLQKNSNGDTDSTSPKFAYKKDGGSKFSIDVITAIKVLRVLVNE